MTIPIRLNVLKDGHIVLRIGDDARIEILVEGTMLVAAYQGNSPTPTLEYSTALTPPAPKMIAAPVKPPPPPFELTPPPLVLPPMPTYRTAPPPAPKPKPAPQVSPQALEALDELTTTFPPPQLPRLSKRDIADEFRRISGRKTDISDISRLMRLAVRAERIVGRPFPIDPNAPLEPQRELFFAELREWWRVRTHRRVPIVLGKDAPDNYTVHRYVLARIGWLNAPTDPEKLLFHYDTYNKAMGTNHPIPANLSLLDAFKHLIGLVHEWHDKQHTAYVAKHKQAARDTHLRGLFGGINVTKQ